MRPIAIARVAVVIPAHDEEAVLGACLASVAAACRRLPASVEPLVVVVLDACTDRSLAVACEGLAGVPGAILETSVQNVGEARALGVRHALGRVDDDVSRLWLAFTDADSVVPEGWLVDQCALARAGAAGIAGVVRVDDWGAHPAHRARAYEAWYRRAPAGEGSDDVHQHVHGANLGVRADAYLHAGGFEPLATGEDHALWERLRRHGHPLVATRRIAVRTSSRLDARAPRGFADFLRQHVAEGQRMPGEPEEAVA